MKILKNKISAIAVSILFILSMTASLTLLPNAHAQNLQVPTISFINVAPNPCGVGQTVTVNFWLAVPIYDVQDAHGLTVVVTNPSGVSTTLGPFTTDTTGGTNTYYTPSVAGNYTFQMFYPGENFTSASAVYKGDYNEPSKSNVFTLIVTQTPRGGLPNTPLPTAYWQTPVNAENVQEWASLTGSEMGYGATTFAATGNYNNTGNYNPYTSTPDSAHILWTKPYVVGGVAGGELGNSEEDSSYWATNQYDPRYAPVIMEGTLYSTWYTTQTGSNDGIISINLYTGATNWVLNTTAILRCGMITNWKNINQYGDVGPYLWATGTLPPSQTGGHLIPNSGTQWDMYDALTGQYICSIVNGSSPTWLGQDADGNIIGYVINGTNGNMMVNGKQVTINTTATGDNLEMWNLTAALGETGSNEDWSIALNSIYLWRNGLEWSVPMDPTINGQLVTGLGTGMFGIADWVGNTLVMSTGTVSVSEQIGYIICAGYSTTNGALEWIYNYTATGSTPSGAYMSILNPSFTRYSTGGTTTGEADGVWCLVNQATYQLCGYSSTTGKQLWATSLNVQMADGNMPNSYDSFGFSMQGDGNNGVVYVWALGGDVWAVNITNGDILWTWSSYQINGPAGTESPYGVYPIYLFNDEALAGTGENTVLYLAEGHQYTPPLFHGALQLALNATTGQLVWSNLGFDLTDTEITYGILTTLNAYDNQIYAYAQGPSQTTISAPQIGVTTATPITLTGAVTDVSVGASQQAVKANFPNGLPCVSDASMTGFMEAVYEQQPMPSNVTGVPVQFYVLDSNNNYREIGSTTTDSLGDYAFTWTPDIPGNYTVYAVFAGTSGYYGSEASTGFYASSPAAATPTQAPVSSNFATTSELLTGIAALAVVIVIIGAVLALIMLRKRP